MLLQFLLLCCMAALVVHVCVFILFFVIRAFRWRWMQWHLEAMIM